MGFWTNWLLFRLINEVFGFQPLIDDDTDAMIEAELFQQIEDEGDIDC